MGSILCLEKTNDSLNISYNLPKRGECVQLLLAHFQALNSQISYCTPFGCRKQTLKGNLQLAMSSGQRRFKLQRKKGSRAGVNSKESFLEEGDIKASLHNELALIGGKLSERSLRGTLEKQSESQLYQARNGFAPSCPLYLLPLLYCSMQIWKEPEKPRGDENGRYKVDQHRGLCSVVCFHSIKC